MSIIPSHPHILYNFPFLNTIPKPLKESSPILDFFHNCSVKSLMKVPEGQSFGNKLLMKKN
jgi:hypothetical protein